MLHINRLLLLLMIVFYSSGCIRRLPSCPELPVYPNAQRINYVEEQEVLRKTTYTVKALPQDILVYYKDYLQNHGWLMTNEHAQGFAMRYRTTSEEPPFYIGVVIDRGGESIITYHVGILIEGPFAWRDWCPTGRP